MASPWTFREREKVIIFPINEITPKSIRNQVGQCMNRLFLLFYFTKHGKSMKHFELNSFLLRGHFMLKRTRLGLLEKTIKELRLLGGSCVKSLQEFKWLVIRKINKKAVLCNVGIQIGVPIVLRKENRRCGFRRGVFVSLMNWHCIFENNRRFVFSLLNNLLSGRGRLKFSRKGMQWTSEVTAERARLKSAFFFDRSWVLCGAIWRVSRESLPVRCNRPFSRFPDVIFLQSFLQPIQFKTWKGLNVFLQSFLQKL